MLLTKQNIPSTGRNLFHRSDLFDQLNEGLKCKLILISAPVVTGATVSVTDENGNTTEFEETAPGTFTSQCMLGIESLSQGTLPIYRLKGFNPP